jgi:ABC-type transporter MlaC component
MVGTIVKIAIFLSLFFTEILLAQPPDEEILFIFTSTVDNFRTSFEQINQSNGDILKGTDNEKGYCALVEKHFDYKKFAQLTIEKLKIEFQPSESEIQAFLQAIKSYLANEMVNLFSNFSKKDATQLSLKLLHPQYALVQLTKPSKPDIVFLTEREARLYPILDIIENGASKIGAMKIEFQNLLDKSPTQQISILTEYLNIKNTGVNNHGLCE